MEITAAITRFSGSLLELLGVSVITFSAVLALLLSIYSYFKKERSKAIYLDFRHRLGKGILFGLEFLVAGDIIRSVAVEPSLTSVAVLGGIVLIRTFLSFTLEIEMSGRLPWKGGAEKTTGKDSENS